MRIDGEGLQLYVVGLEKVGKRWRPQAATTNRPPCDDVESVRPKVTYSLSVPTGPTAVVTGDGS